LGAGERNKIITRVQPEEADQPPHVSMGNHHDQIMIQWETTHEFKMRGQTWRQS
jgi:hypothetical protein